MIPHVRWLPSYEVFITIKSTCQYKRKGAIRRKRHCFDASNSLRGSRRRLCSPLATSPRGLGAVRSKGGLVSQPRGGRAQVGSTTEMKLDRDDQIDADGDLGKPIECSLERLQTPEIVGQDA
jgi:hypothetical protein